MACSAPAIGTKLPIQRDLDAAAALAGPALSSKVEPGTRALESTTVAVTRPGSDHTYRERSQMNPAGPVPPSVTSALPWSPVA
jgi:hypothetical protein